MHYICPHALFFPWQDWRQSCAVMRQLSQAPTSDGSITHNNPNITQQTHQEVSRTQAETKIILLQMHDKAHPLALYKNANVTQSLYLKTLLEFQTAAGATSYKGKAHAKAGSKHS